VASDGDQSPEGQSYAFVVAQNYLDMDRPQDAIAVLKKLQLSVLKDQSRSYDWDAWLPLLWGMAYRELKDFDRAAAELISAAAAVAADDPESYPLRVAKEQAGMMPSVYADRVLGSEAVKRFGAEPK
jgi:hypothetical protein